MATILDEIVEHRRVEVEETKRRIPLDQIQSQLNKSDRDFEAALRDPKPAFILEYKKASPSKGLIRTEFDLDEITHAYAPRASAVSVLTESKYFQGSFENLCSVRTKLTQPILCKDFIVDPYQIYKARSYGADAVLLILAILDDRQYVELQQTATQLGMDAVTEVSNQEEQRRAIELKSRIVGINNRNLRDMSIDLDTTRILAGSLREGALVISESGFNTHTQVRELSKFCDGFLIGSSLMAQENLTIAVNGLIFGENKICGLTRAEDVLAAERAGAVYGGMIFAGSSPRKIDLQHARTLFSAADLLPVGVFQDHSVEFVVSTSFDLTLSAVQLHGDENMDYLQSLREKLPRQCQIWKALTVEQAQNAESWFEVSVDRLVVDNRSSEQSGGTGTTFDWSRLPASYCDRLMIAGGLNADNAAAAAEFGCIGLDFNSGVEESPGIKNAAKIQAVFKELRTY